MIRRTWLLSDEEREAAERDGERKGERRGERKMLAHMIGLRFPKATPEFIKNALKPFNDGYMKELSTALMTTDSLEEFQKRVQTLAPSC